MPFYDRASRAPNEIILPDVRDAPDPNSRLYQKNAELPPDVRVPQPTPQQQQDELGQFIAGLGQLEEVPEGSLPKSPPPASAADSTGSSSTPSTSASGTPAGSGSPAQASAGSDQAAAQSSTPSAQTTYFLQAGAFRSASDADAVKARIIMLGLDANVQVAQLDGAPINRVRVGPFKGIDELNQARATLGAQDIETSVVRN